MKRIKGTHIHIAGNTLYFLKGQTLVKVDRVKHPFTHAWIVKNGTQIMDDAGKVKEKHIRNFQTYYNIPSETKEKMKKELSSATEFCLQSGITFFKIAY